MPQPIELERSSPEAEGIPSAAVLEFIHALEQHVHPLSAVQGFMLLRHGNVAAEGWWTPYSPRSRHPLQSLSKSFTSSAIGLAIQEGLLTVNDPVLQFFPDDAPTHPSENLKAMRVKHLLSMNTGHDQDTTERVYQHLYQINVFGPWLHQRKYMAAHPESPDDNWPQVFLSLPVAHEPGSWFVYNTAATYMLSAIVTKLTGQSLVDYLRPRLFEPLGIESPFWETDPQGINLGGSGLHGTVEEIARFGQMYLQKGIWNGKRILTEEWISEATSIHSDNSNTQTNPDWTAGYGYQFWRCCYNCYRGDGAFGQFCVVMPEQDAVLAVIGGLLDMQSVLDKVWRILLPAMQTEALHGDPRGNEKLLQKQSRLSLPLSSGQPVSPTIDRWSGRSYKLGPNYLELETIALEFREGGSKLILRDQRGDHTIEVGYGDWLKGTTSLRGYADEPVAANGAWTAEDIYEVRLCYDQSFFCPIFRFRYIGTELQIQIEPNVSWEPSKVTTIHARLTG